MSDPLTHENASLKDQIEREKALNTEESFIVRAPAGSGKTRLLTERFLHLLTCVESPEHILAITFTKKAAHEMKARLVRYLFEEQKDENLLKIRNKVLQHAKEQGWNLQKQVNNLNIHTIDALWHRLARFSSSRNHSLMTNSSLKNNPRSLYRVAIEETLNEMLSSKDETLQKSATLLLKRKKNQLLGFEQSKGLLDELTVLLSKRAHHLMALKGKVFQDSWILDYLMPLSTLECSLEPIFQDITEKNPQEKLNLFRSLVAIHLTQKGMPTKQTFKKDGHFHSNILKKKSWFEELYGDLDDEKSQEPFKKVHDILEELSPFLLERLSFCSKINPDAQADEEGIAALETCLALCEKKLMLHFQKEGILDHAQIQKEAIDSLDPLKASDYAIALSTDRLHHILMDEAQDTSQEQFDALESLCQNFESPYQTLFLVGDPMQSIYGFRGTNPSIFLRLWKNQSLANLKLTPISLSTNFRSSAPLIQIVNQHFKTLMPNPSIDLWSGSADFTESDTLKPSAYESQKNSVSLTLHAEEKDKTPEFIASCCQKALEEGSKSIGILVRKKAHILPIEHALKSIGLAVHSSGGISSIEKQWIQISIELLSTPFDRDVWLRYLRSKLFGFTLSELEMLFQDTHSSTPNTEHLNPDAKFRFQKAQMLFEWLLFERKRSSQKEVLLKLWVHLSKVLIPFEHKRQNFMRWIEKLVSEPSFDLMQSFLELDFENALELESSIQLCTIHKAKGLEFDVVILPHLESASKPKADWFLSDKVQGNLCDLKQEKESIHDWLSLQKKAQEEEEHKRLWYVALTRAKKHLILQWNPYALKGKNNFLTLLQKTESEKVSKECERFSFENKGEKDNPEENKKQKNQFHALQRLTKKRLELLDFFSIPMGKDEPFTPSIERFQKRLLGETLHALLEDALEKKEMEPLSTLLKHPKIKHLNEQTLLQEESIKEALFKMSQSFQKDPCLLWLQKVNVQTERPFWDEASQSLRYIDALVTEERQTSIIEFKMKEALFEEGFEALFEEETSYYEQLKQYQTLLAPQKTPIVLILSLPLLGRSICLLPKKPR